MKKIATGIIVAVLMITAINVKAQEQTQQGNAAADVPTNTIAVPDHENMYVCETDEPVKMTRSAAVGICNRKGDGWRLPTVAEMNIFYAYYLYLQLTENSYWTQDRDMNKLKFFTYSFKNGKAKLEKSDASRLVRCVWEKPVTENKN